MQDLNRRNFIRVAGAASAASMFSGKIHALVAPQAETAAPRSPNDNIQLALIGAGIQGQSDTRFAVSVPGVKLVAVADCYDGRLGHCKEIFGNEIFTTRNYAEILERKDVDAVIVATPDLTSLRNAKNIIDILKSARPNDAPPRLVINQIGIPKRPEIPTKDFAETMGVEPSALIAFEPTLFGQSANNGQMVIETSAKAPVAEAMRQLCRAITGRSLQGAGAKNTSSIFSFFKKRA